MGRKKELQAGAGPQHVGLVGWACAGWAGVVAGGSELWAPWRHCRREVSLAG